MVPIDLQQLVSSTAPPLNRIASNESVTEQEPLPHKWRLPNCAFLP
jgi:hypothetical protein